MDFVDLHFHVAPAGFLGLARPDPGPGLDAFPQLRDGAVGRRELAATGGKAVISLPWPVLPGADIEETTAAVRLCNDELLATAAEHGEYAGAMITVDLTDPATAVAELGRVCEAPAGVMIAGVMIYVSPTSRLDDNGCAEFYAELSARQLPLFLHPALEPPVGGATDWNLNASLSPPVVTSIAAARLMLSGTLDEHPGLTLVIPHLGGVLPYLAQRLVDQSDRGAARHDIPTYLRTRTYLDTCSFHRPALRCALDTVGPGRLVLGSDYPFRGPVERALADIADSGLDAATRESILCRNAAALTR
ncbi:amidohydrolase family protein [Mycobacterium sp. Aquia_216]|uniref:amidohydrolase family protein n=1 Tax=Mycobacterium sp. Aquia_216 TaxID=2991729 RepID=UPI00227B14D1|nr:amidohydrolase family protein [Mycobacterium sp. Aquia_216]WAJ46231.1 amidohydrolase family protein [Mycobacterium sp. Aquia_216]